MNYNLSFHVFQIESNINMSKSEFVHTVTLIYKKGGIYTYIIEALVKITLDKIC